MSLLAEFCHCHDAEVSCDLLVVFLICGSFHLVVCTVCPISEEYGIFTCTKKLTKGTA